MFCKNCGKEMDDNAQYCPACGSSQAQSQKPVIAPDPNDSGSIGWAFLGFFVPIAGLILYILWARTRPKSGLMAGLGALVNVIATIVFCIVYGIIIAILASNGDIHFSDLI